MDSFDLARATVCEELLLPPQVGEGLVDESVELRESIVGQLLDVELELTRIVFLWEENEFSSYTETMLCRGMAGGTG